MSLFGLVGSLVDGVVSTPVRVAKSAKRFVVDGEDPVKGINRVTDGAARDAEQIVEELVDTIVGTK